MIWLKPLDPHTSEGHIQSSNSDPYTHTYVSDADLFWLTPPPEPNCRCAVVVIRYSGNAHQRRVKRRAWERARRKGMKA